jgi:hypothetical protein
LCACGYCYCRPYPILDFVDTAEVAHHTAQPLLLTAHALPTAQPGNYSVRVSLSDATGAQQSVDITVEVFDFTLPLTPSLPTFWGVASRDNPSIWGPQASTEEFADRFADFLLDHRKRPRIIAEPGVASDFFLVRFLTESVCL